MGKTLKMDEFALSLAQQWNFVPTEVLPGGHCSHVFANETQVLKVPFQGEEKDSGYWAMINFQGQFKPEIYESDPASGSMLMQRAVPGHQLNQTGLSDEDQLELWVEVVKSWRATDTQGFITLEDFAGKTDPLAVHLLTTTTTTVATHGDLHHANILSDGENWLCIDAKGVVGDPAFEGAAFVRNPLPTIGEFSALRMEERVHQVAHALKVEPFRVWGWSVVMLRDGGDPEPGPWRNALERLNDCAHVFNAEQWVRPIGN